MRHIVGSFVALAAGAALFVVAVPHALGIMALPPLATVALDVGVDAVLTTHRPDKVQARAIRRVDRLVSPQRMVGQEPHRAIADVKRIIKAIGHRFDAQIADPQFGLNVCNEVGAWVDGVGVQLHVLAVDAGRADERRIARAFDKADRLFQQSLHARDLGNGPKTLHKMARCMKQYQKIAELLNVDIRAL